MTEVRESGASAASELYTRLSLLFEWYKGMISEETGKLLYLYDPEEDATVAEGPALRQLAGLADAAEVGRVLGRPDLDAAIDRALTDYLEWLIPHIDGIVLDPARLGEPASIAHNAFAILAFSRWNDPGRAPILRGLGDAIVSQQRDDGSFRIAFGGEPDAGLALYPGAAQVALLEAARITGQEPYRKCVLRGLDWARGWHARGEPAPDLLVFFAAWQTACCARLAPVPRARAFAYALQDQVLASRYFEGVAGAPLGQVTIQVAAALEGMCDGYVIANHDGDRERQHRYRACARTALAWLADAQYVGSGPEREIGGFGYSGGDRTQRLDVVGHVARSLCKCVQAGIV